VPAVNFTINEWAIIALVFVLGWLLGLASRSDRRWRQKYEDERTAHEALRRDHATLQSDHDARIANANRRITELERRDPVAPVASVGASVAASSAVAPGRRDDLTRIDGIDSHDEIRLNDAGVHGFRDVAALGDDEAAALESRVGFTSGRIATQRWREQAEQLANDLTGTFAGGTDDHRRL
jgi:predicted flap endonuclease-1-like 5' DNA nuclease